MRSKAPVRNITNGGILADLPFELGKDRRTLSVTRRKLGSLLIEVGQTSGHSGSGFLRNRLIEYSCIRFCFQSSVLPNFRRTSPSSAALRIFRLRRLQFD